jgi:hypothetical protein
VWYVRIDLNYKYMKGDQREFKTSSYILARVVWYFFLLWWHLSDRPKKRITLCKIDRSLHVVKDVRQETP